MPTHIAVDAMGGDHAPHAVVEGAVRALKRPEATDLRITLFGPEERVQEALRAHDDVSELPLSVRHAPDVIAMDDAPAAALKRKRQSSIHLGLQAHRTGATDAFVSAGNTGAIMAASMFILGRIKGIERPSIVGFFPTLKDDFSVVIDIGTNVDCKPAHLLQFARMGTIYARHVLQIDAPTVGLINIGEEPGKGNEQVKEAHALLSDDTSINFAGNVEGGDLLHHAADVLICDGFIGNVLLKFGESMTTVLSTMTKNEMERQGLTKEEQKLVAGVLSNVQQGFDHENRGGAPLVGVNGAVFIGHGRSSARAIEQGIYSAADLASKDLVPVLEEAFAP
ncbi:MAG: phosphate acyltransferase PlsX [Longimonas sp.]|uniref:phosphate acyltransferase PlsX n=1 Tax=Longimonas sp. TaxID=2039626 RepID=UPI00334CC4FB